MTIDRDLDALAETFDTVPRVFPRELPQTSRLDVVRRGRQIALVTAKHFAPLALRSALTRRMVPDAYAKPLRKTFEELGATFMKFGQLIGSSPNMPGDDPISWPNFMNVAPSSSKVLRNGLAYASGTKRRVSADRSARGAKCLAVTSAI